MNSLRKHDWLEMELFRLSLVKGWKQQEFQSQRSNYMSNMAGTDSTRDYVKTNSSSGDVQAEVEALRKDVARLTAQLADNLASTGNAAWNLAKTNLEGAVSDVGSKGQEAVDAVRDVGDNMVDAIDQSLRTRPYTTLALAIGIGFLFGATWRR